MLGTLDISYPRIEFCIDKKQSLDCFVVSLVALCVLVKEMQMWECSAHILLDLCLEILVDEKPVPRALVCCVQWL